MAFIIHMQHRFHIQRSPQQSRSPADPAAPLQINKVFHRKPMTYMKHFRFQRFGVVFQAHAFVPVLYRKIYEQTLAR